MQDQLVSIETAKKLEDKGFWWKTFHFMYVDQRGDRQLDYGFRNPNRTEDILKVPTQSLVQKWIRVEFNKNVYPVSKESGWICVVIDIDDEDDYHFSRIYKTYEDSMEAGIQLFLEEILK